MNKQKINKVNRAVGSVDRGWNRRCPKQEASKSDSGIQFYFG